MKKRTLSLLLALCMMFSLSVAAMAAEPNQISAAGETGTTTVDLTAAATTFDVTVPTSLVIDVAGDGSVTCATDAKIINNSFGAVKVTGVALTGANDWASMDYDAMNPATMKVNEKKFAMAINNVKTTGANTVDTGAVDVANFPALMGAKVVAADGSVSDVTDGSNELAITYQAKVAPQDAEVSQQVASVVFTIGWDAQA